MPDWNFLTDWNCTRGRVGWYHQCADNHQLVLIDKLGKEHPLRNWAERETYLIELLRYYLGVHCVWNDSKIYHPFQTQWLLVVACPHRRTTPTYSAYITMMWTLDYLHLSCCCRTVGEGHIVWEHTLVPSPLINRRADGSVARWKNQKVSALNLSITQLHPTKHGCFGK